MEKGREERGGSKKEREGSKEEGEGRREKVGREKNE